jgi:hypothetical protein
MKHRTKKKPARRPAPKRAPLRAYFAGQDAPPRLGIVEDALDELDERLEKAESRISWNHWALAGLAAFAIWANWNKAKSLAFKTKDKGRELVEAAREKMSGDESEV